MAPHTIAVESYAPSAPPAAEPAPPIDPTDLAAWAALSRAERMLFLGGQMGGRGESLGATLRLMAAAMLNAAVDGPSAELRDELRTNAYECRVLAAQIDLAAALAQNLGVNLGAGALELSRMLDASGSEPDFGPAGRGEMRIGAERARALVRHLARSAAAAATGRAS